MDINIVEKRKVKNGAILCLLCGPCADETEQEINIHTFFLSNIGKIR